jgi:hypothetical protein
MTKQSTGKFWAAVPVVLLGALTGGLGIVAYVATRDPSFAVERDYYKKAVNYDEQRDQDETNQKLGWRLNVQARADGSRIQLDAKIDDSHGKPVEDAQIQVEAFPIARSAMVTTTRFASGTAQLPLVATGLWELRFTVDSRGLRFTQTIRRDIGLNP